MFFCPKCDNIFDIKHVALQDPDITKGGEMEGGAPPDVGLLIKKIISQTKLSPEEMNDIVKLKEDIIKHKDYKKLSKIQKEYVDNKISDLSPKDLSKVKMTVHKKKDAYFVCKNCGFEDKMKPDTLLYERGCADNEQVLENVDYSDMVHDNTLMRDRKYSCVNEKCPSHTDPTVREAVGFRKHMNSYEMIYVCTACETALKI